MAVIAINQQLGSRGDELGQLAADALGYRFWGRSELINAASRAYDVDPVQFLIIDERQPHFWERPKVDTDRLRAFLRAVLFKEMARDRVVFASSSGAQLVPANGCGLRIRVVGALAVRVNNISKIEKLTVVAAEKRVRDHDREVKARAHTLYAFDIDDPHSRILILEDEPMTTRMIETGFAKHKDRYLIQLSSNPVDALIQVGKKLPDLFVMDLTMPGMDGFQVCSILKSNSATKDMKILAISKGKLTGSQHDFLAKNVDLFLPKPFKMNGLLEAVDRLLA